MQTPIIIIASVIFFTFMLVIVSIFVRHSKETKALQRKVDEYEDRFRRAQFASAVIVSVINSNTISRTEMKVNLRLEIQPQEGNPYLQQTSWLINIADLSYLKQGETVQIKIDSEDSSIIYPTFDRSKFWVWS